MEQTQEQKDKIAKLNKLAVKNSFRCIGTTIKWVSLLLLANLSVSFLSAYVHSTLFGFIGGALNGFFIFRALLRELTKNYDRLREEAKKIVSENN